jgi:hypothetical protein
VNDSSAIGNIAEVWGSTWIPGPAPLQGYGSEAGYSVAWVRVLDGAMIQVLVATDSAPSPGTTGHVHSVDAADETIDVFEPDAGASS